MNADERLDNLVVKTHDQGEVTNLSQGDKKMVEVDPAGVTITRGLKDRFPVPSDSAAAELMQSIFQAHRESDGPMIVELARRFQTLFGWHPRAEWFLILGLEIVNDDHLIDAQQQFLDDLNDFVAGKLEKKVCPTSEPFGAEVIEWTQGGNNLNMMEWLWKADQNDRALNYFQNSFLGLGGNDDNGRRIERYLYQASCLARLSRTEESKLALKKAKETDSQEFHRVWELFKARMPELEGNLSV